MQRTRSTSHCTPRSSVDAHPGYPQTPLTRTAVQVRAARDNICIVRIARCAVSVRFQHPGQMTEEDALTILRRSFELTEHRPYVVLVDMALISGISPGARRMLISARHILASAMLGQGPMDRILSASFERAVYPSEYFTDQDTALQWRSVMHDVLCTDPVDHTMSLTVDLDPFTPPRHRHRTAPSA